MSESRAETRRELTALCQEHNVTRDQIDEWLQMPLTRVGATEKLSADLIVTLMAWRMVEEGAIVRNDDGTWALP